jgi:PAS domain S-box-containing protein
MAMTELPDEGLSDFFEQAAVGLHFVGPDGTILRANKAELDLLGYSADEYIGHNIAEFHADEPVIKDILCRLTNGDELHSYEARLKHKNGDIKYVLISSNVRRGPNGEFLHTRCFTRDITDRKLAEEARAHATAMRRLAAQLQIAREDERRSLARQLHDELIAGLTAAAMDLHNVQVALAARGDPLAQNVEMVMRLLSASVDAKRKIIESLRPTILHELGLGAALRLAAKRFTARTGIACAMQVDDKLQMDEELALVLYRITQQALDGVTPESGAAEVSLRLAQEANRAVLTLTDDRPRAGSKSGLEGCYELEGCEQLLAGWGGVLSVSPGARGAPMIHAIAPLRLDTPLH